jgi:glutamyl-tRNA reductase
MDWAQALAVVGEPLREWAILTTCHRFELYFVATTDALQTLSAQLHTLLSNTILGQLGHGTEIDQRSWLMRTDGEAVEHLCRVAAGLDSLVLGEAQIQGQVIEAYTQAMEAGTIGPTLSALFRTAIRVGKRARTETSISSRAVSLSSVALEMAQRHLPNLNNVRVLVIGAGEMSRLALKALFQRRIEHVTIANRTLARAEAMRMHPKWRTLDLADLDGELANANVIFSATSAPGYMVTRRQLEMARRGRTPREDQVLIDLAVPRDIDPEVRTLSDAILIDVDDLRNGLDQSVEYRKQSLPLVNAIIADELNRWQTEQRELSMRPYVVELRQRAERIRQQQVERTMRFLGAVDEHTEQHIHHLSRALVNQLLHEPTIRLKELAHVDEADAHLTAICNIFGLDNEPTISDSTIPDTVENAKLRGEQDRL